MVVVETQVVQVQRVAELRRVCLFGTYIRFNVDVVVGFVRSLGDRRAGSVLRQLGDARDTRHYSRSNLLLLVLLQGSLDLRRINFIHCRTVSSAFTLNRGRILIFQEVRQVSRLIWFLLLEYRAPGKMSNLSIVHDHRLVLKFYLLGSVNFNVTSLGPP